MKYYNQHDFKSVPYPSGPSSTADIALAGCGVCTCANVLQFFGIPANPKDLAQTFIQQGFRVPSGTDMAKASQWIVKTYPDIELQTTNDETVLYKWLVAGGIAIANVDGDEGSKGVFSSAGHFINVIGVNGQQLVCFDVGYYKGKYDAPYRKPYVTLTTDGEGNILQTVSQATLDADTKNRTPNYYLFRKKAQEPLSVAEAKALVKRLTGLSDSTLQYLSDDYIWGDSLIEKLATAMQNKKSSPLTSPSLEEAKSIVQKQAGLDDSTIAYLSYYRWNTDLFIKLAKEL